MKRIIACSLILLCSLFSSYAQLQNSLLGCKLGTTTRAEIKAMYPNAVGNWAGDIDVAYYPGSELNYSITNGEPALNLRGIKFAGIEWDGVNFSFYLGKLCEVNFSSNEGIDISSWRELCSALSNKYGKYRIVKSDGGPNDLPHLIFSDGNTRIITSYNSLGHFYNLHYQHISLFKKKYQKRLDASEL